MIKEEKINIKIIESVIFVVKLNTGIVLSIFYL